MNAVQHQGRAEAAAARRQHLKRHFVGRERLQAMPQPFDLDRVDAGAGAAGIDQPAVGIVASQCERLGGQSRRVRQDGDSRCRTLSTVAAQAVAASAPFTTKWSWKNFLCSSCS